MTTSPTADGAPADLVLGAVMLAFDVLTVPDAVARRLRAAGSDENIILTPPIKFSLEQALEFIDDDELVEVTPASIRLRKKLLTENERKREQRKAADG